MVVVLYACCAARVYGNISSYPLLRIVRLKQVKNDMFCSRGCKIPQATEIQQRTQDAGNDETFRTYPCGSLPLADGVLY